MKIIFIRHGKDKNDKLTLLGKLQSKLIVKDLAYENITKIYSSPLNRAVKTAKIISKRLKINKISIDSRIKERESVNKEMTENEIIEFKQNYLNPNFSRQNPEGLKEYKARIFSFLDEVISDNKNDDNIVIVGHSSMTYILGAYFYKPDKNKDLVWTRVGNCSKLCFEYKK